eukprot:Seg1232.10 transcript_id=Seg1232.10/GoldUCD/mRNA.D3Y31 product="Cilia- and flagella-associated protein 300" protein_id=Seg1232.10/GoldUCD/D3Y31
MAGMAKTFKFHFVDNKTFASFAAKSTQEFFLKWGLKERMVVQMFSYDLYFQESEKGKFAMDFFKDPDVQTNLKVPSRSNTMGPIGDQKPTRVDVQVIPSTVTNMEFFDRIYRDGLVRTSGTICKCYDEQLDGFLVSDELRKMVISEDSDFYDLFGSSERDEFIYRIFKHICLGGLVCQYEDDVKPYLDTAKFLYKDLVSVHKDSNKNKLVVSSIVLKVTVWTNDVVVYPGDEEHEQSFAYLIVNPTKRQVTVWSHSWKS